MSEKIHGRSIDELVHGPRAPERELAPEVERIVETLRTAESRPDGRTAPATSPALAAATSSTSSTPVSRRGFLQVVGAGSALVALEGCNPPKGRAMPYTRPPEGAIPSKPLHFATSAPMGGYTSGLVATSYDGRPTKIEGNPDHPANRGATGAWEQALLLGLYDPNRARAVRHKGQPVSRAAFWKAIADGTKRLQATKGKGLRLLLEADGSPLVADLVGRVQAQLPEARVVTWSPLGRERTYEGARIAFGRPLETHYDLTRADIIVSLDADFLSGPWPEALRLSREYADRRVPEVAEKGHGGAGMNRLYAVESNLTMTGMAADHRLRARSSEVGGIAAALLAALGAEGIQLPADVIDRLRSIAGAGSLPAERARFVAALAKDLRAHPGRVAVLVGERQPAVVHAIGHAINNALGALGQTVTFTAPVAASSGIDAVAALTKEMEAGQVDTLVIGAWNPVYSAPADLAFGERLKKVPNVVYLSLYEDETARLATWQVPLTHTFESWGDGRAPDGTVSLQQPLITPLFGGVTVVEVLAALASPEGRHDATAQTLLVDSWRTRRGLAMTAFPAFWEAALRKGIVDDTALGREQAALAWASLGAAVDAARGRDLAPVPAKEAVEIGFYLDNRILDGRFANNAWLQELPDPVTKLTWDNAALLSAATAQRLGVGLGDVIEIGAGGRTVQAPVVIVPGHADDAVSLALGYGRDGAELNARGVGANANTLRTAASPWFMPGTVKPTGGAKHKLAITQEHGSMEGRKHALEATLAELQHEVPAAIEEMRAPLPTIHAPVPYPGHKWGMSIDLSRCIGCSACVVGCQSENNIPAVGKEGVMRTREMQWLRIDRYFMVPEGRPLDEAEAISQPVACVHCEMAPCEYVCPVNATVHSDEGLNEMIYNRCVGTRYCANNCPYKVRHFNFFDYTSQKTPVESMLMNPDVTVRSRGVMEKCTYCVQRIEQVRISARVEGREIRPGEVVTACQQACPTHAITFGDLNDKTAEVTVLRNDKRAYYLLHDLGTRPRTAYLARVKNPNPALVTETKAGAHGGETHHG